jgi:hypothetical protein
MKAFKFIKKIIMKNKMLVIIAFSIACTSYSQEDFDWTKYNIEKEKILNVIINSAVFDSIYSGDNTIFKENVLLPRTTNLKLVKRNSQVIILEKVDKTKDYIVIGDFTMGRVDPQIVLVQFENPHRGLVLNLGLEKLNGEWVITGHVIMDS